MKNAYQAIKFIDQLNHTDDLTQRILDGHTKYSFVLKCWSFVYTLVKSMIFIGIGYSHRLRNQ